MKRLLVILLLVGAIGGAYVVGRARAAGVPATGALFYSGYLTDMAGQPDAGTHSFILKLYVDSTTTTAACTVAASLPVVNGRFRLQLDETCTAAVHANPDLFLELAVDAQVFPRSKLGAVPYALEAASVPFSGVSGISPTTAWPGAVSPDRLVAGTGKGWVRTGDVNGTGLYAAGISGTSVASSTGTWVSSVVHTGTGNYDVNLVANVFTVPPICLAVAEFGGDFTAVAAGATTGTVHVAVDTNSGMAEDQPFNILCVGR